MSKSPITCHVLDSSIGKPASGIDVILQRQADAEDAFETITTGITNSDGRCMSLYAASGPEAPSYLVTGRVYKVIFKTKDYFENTGRKCFYPYVEISFEVGDAEEHYHIPLLISPYSYTTYRGS